MFQEQGVLKSRGRVCLPYFYNRGHDPYQPGAQFKSWWFKTLLSPYRSTEQET